MTASVASDRASRLRVVASPRARDVIIRDERATDVAARERLLDHAFGPLRFAKTCQRLRDGQVPARSLAFVASDGKRLIGTLRFWNIRAGDRPALLLGPLAVAETHRCKGIGDSMMRAGLHRARRLGHAAVLLVGDAPYYERFGFERRLTEGLLMPGPIEDERFLGLDLLPGALAGAQGLIVPATSGSCQAAASFRRAA